ncbi:MAG: DUF1080 domain-containing protein [Saprospiraceae bacterium]|nr:DUF1080 domain-containing protein [Saprospiraceae bacterium]
MRIFLWLCLLLLPVLLPAQEHSFPMQRVLNSAKLSDIFTNVPANWQQAGGVQFPFETDERPVVQSGMGFLVNLPSPEHHDNLVFGFEHGDLDLECDVYMARHSNSGIYLQGRYEIQLLDSWGKPHASFGDIGGVYERWDNNKPEGQKGFQGIAPLSNAARAPGLRQHLRIEFQAPRFDAAGKKTSNARLIRVQLNGVTIQENVELSGPTRGAALPGEAPTGPIVLQGDHGAVAFSDLRSRTYGGAPAQLRDLQYRYFSGEHEYLPDFSKLKADAAGPAEALTWEYAKGDNDFALQFKGLLVVPDSGNYVFSLQSNANSMLQINGDTLIGQGWWTRTASVSLPAGNIPIEVTYCKAAEWLEPALGLFVEGPHIRPSPLHLPSSYTLSKPTAPILIEVGREPELLRSFIDITGENGQKRRLTHAISVGYPEALNYTYDLDNGALVQVWRGGFLDATPMWHERGDGHAEPLGGVVLLNSAAPLAPEAAGLAIEYRLLGYQLDDSGNPTYRYQAYGQTVSDRLSPLENGKKLAREIRFEEPVVAGLHVCLAKANIIEPVGANIWAINFHEYYIQVPAGQSVELYKTETGSELRLPAKGVVQYQIIW